ncbi:hypothetical protein TSAR_017051 [Trichomalopsis sarcophagae]|uniref:Fibroblast growth factor n=1 Tax=Trichomalopsis sarcophagae TaxID=543379 RepID=A0A232FH96_9HYME|nr:hypothetical protein TSAR_017051 [Trichomalopsis sarcophagae]
MSLRWIHENLEPPNCDEECSDIDDSCSDDSYDSDLDLPDGISCNNSNNNYDSRNHNDNQRNNNNVNGQNGLVRSKRETLRHPTTTVSIDENGKPHFETEEPEKTQKPHLTWDQASNNPMYCQSLKLKLFCRTGYFIGITPSGRARGFPAESTNDAHVRLIVCPVSSGIVRLQSAETGHYLAFNATGHLYGEKRVNKDNTEWEQWSIGTYDAFRSHKYAEPGWWLGIKRNGRHKPGPKTAWGQKAVQFLAVRLA